MTDPNDLRGGDGRGLLAAICALLLGFGAAVHFWTAHAPPKPSHPERRSPAAEGRTAPSETLPAAGGAERPTGPPNAEKGARVEAREDGLRVVSKSGNEVNPPSSRSRPAGAPERPRESGWVKIPFTGPEDQHVRSEARTALAEWLGGAVGLEVEAADDGSIVIHLPDDQSRIEGWPEIAENGLAIGRAVMTGRTDPEFLRKSLAAWGRAYGFTSIRVEWDPGTAGANTFPLTIELEPLDPR